MLLLAIETTCDETGAAVLEGTPGVGVPSIRSSVVASQIDLHERFGGVVPEIAAREHVRQILPVIDEALSRAGVVLGEIGAVAVATRPGLVGALVVGLTAAKTLAMALGVPLIAVNHLEGSPVLLPALSPRSPGLSLRRAGGLGGAHQPVFVPRADRIRVARSGRSTMRPARRSTRFPACWVWAIPAARGSSGRPSKGIPKPSGCPRTFLKEDRLEFSFSGLKTAVLYALKGQDARSTGESPPRASSAISRRAFRRR